MKCSKEREITVLTWNDNRIEASLYHRDLGD